jgi:hypothetical protein
VTGNGAALAVAVDGDGHVDLRCGPAPEGGAVLGVERGGDRFRYGPREHSDVEIGSGGERSPGGLLVVGVAGHAAVVEHDEQLCPLALRRPHHVGR